MKPKRKQGGKGRPFKKGDIPNPKGRAPVPEDVREARKVDKEYALSVMSKFLYKSLDELEAMRSDASRPVYEHMLISAAIVSIETGDSSRIDFFLNRLIGKVTDKIEHSLPEPTIIEYPDGAKMELGYKKGS
jgi:hypothetical protein